MTNILKLKGKIVENGLTVEEFAKSIGMDGATLYRKMKNDGLTFSIGEANKIVTTLGLTPGEAMAIFFSDLIA